MFLLLLLLLLLLSSAYRSQTYQYYWSAIIVTKYDDYFFCKWSLEEPKGLLWSVTWADLAPIFETEGYCDCNVRAIYIMLSHNEHYIVSIYKIRDQGSGIRVLEMWLRIL